MTCRILLLLAFCLGASSLSAQEFRAMWVDAFHAGLRTSAETDAVIAAARAANCNAVVVQVRKRGDAYYRNGLEPAAADIAAVPARTIASIQTGSPGVVNTTTNHGLTTGDTVVISGNSGTAPAINGTRRVTVVDLNTVLLDGVNITTAGTGGSVTLQFDPLAALIRRAHTGSPRIEVHAWFVTYNIWGNETVAPTQGTHPYNLHPDWLTENTSGEKWDGANYGLDPGHPAVQLHTSRVVMDVLGRYDVDGVHLDYIRYSDSGSSGNNQPWGYNPVAVQRYRKHTGASSRPSPTTSAWLQWRRDQVTALVRKVYLQARALKPSARVSASLISYGNAPADLTLSTWRNTEAYSRVLQDWRGWMEEGILDLACPMVYRSQTTSTVPASFQGWADYTKRRQFNRAGAIGMGWYLNSVPNNIAQITAARTSAGGFNPAGVLGYSYAVPNNTGTSQTDTWAQLVAGPFANAASVPAMPWKSSTTSGHLMGTVQDVTTGYRYDGLDVILTGPTSRTLKTDGTGFFGAVDIPVGTYTLRFTAPGHQSFTRTVTVAGAQVAAPDLTLTPLPFEITSYASAGNSLAIAWNSIPGRTYRVEQSQDLVLWTVAQPGIAATEDASTTAHTWNIPPGWESGGFLRVVQQ